MLIKQGFSPAKMTHLPLILSEDRFRLTDSLDQGYFLFLGKVEPLKGIFPLLQAAGMVSDLPLLLAGAIKEPLAGQLSGLLPPNATYLGLKSKPEVIDLLVGARALILPSIWYENQPFAILEAFAAGKPVIASDLGGMSELVNDGERGLLAPPGDAGALAAAMRWMANNPGRAREMGKKAQRYALETHAPESHYKKILKIYEDMVAGRHEGANRVNH
jgi:glycosyltransferase involved in cell wall biosynthesis